MHCTTNYQGTTASAAAPPSKNDTGKTKFSGAYYSTEGQWDSSTCDSAKVSAYRRQGQVQSQGNGRPLTTPARASPSRRATRTARRARRRARTTARAKARSEHGLRRMLKVVSGISNRGPSQSVFTAPRGCEYLYSVPRCLAE